MRWRDRLIGIVLGLILGVGIVAGFVFLYSEDTVDAPSISTGDRGGGRRSGGVNPNSLPPVATVRVIDGVPPLHDGEWAMATLEACLAILESARTGREVGLIHQTAPRDRNTLHV